MFSRVEDAIIGLENEACFLVQKLALGEMLPNALPLGMTICMNSYERLNLVINKSVDHFRTF